MHTTALLQKLNELLSAYPSVNAAEVDQLGRILAERTSWELFRINPLQLAEEHGLEPYRVIELFLYGTKIGLFELDWNMICPCCGSIEHSYGSLNQIEMDTFHCVLCNIDIETELDRIVEVSFQLHPQVRELAINPFQDHASYGRYFFSANFIRSQAVAAFIQNQALRGFAAIAPQTSALFSVTAEPGETYRLISLDRHAVCFLRFTDVRTDAMQTVDVTMNEDGYAEKELFLPAGAVEIRLHNSGESDTGVLFLYTDFARVQQLLREEPPSMRPFLSGKMLLNNQKFRETFLVENLPNDLNLRISDLTILFTDLKGSTELYERTGDVFAYRLVQDHFNILTEVVGRHRGATVKTMGDAIMASFCHPADGVRAAMEMIAAMRELNDAQGAGELIGLKVGLHCGPALAVKANETIDFFGQTVNIAARVQARAEAGEVWITEAAYTSAGVGEALHAHGLTAEAHDVLLKGVSSASTVYRCS